MVDPRIPRWSTATVDPAQVLHVPVLLKSTNQLAAEARKAKAVGVANAYERLAKKLRAVRRAEGAVFKYDALGVEVPTITAAQWEELAVKTDVAFIRDLWAEHFEPGAG